MHHTSHSLPSLTGQIKERRVVLERCKSERKVGLCDVGVLKRVPEGVACREQRAPNFLPVALGVLNRGDSGAGLRSKARPAGLGDPDWLAAGDALGLSDA
jgi:hypothetical protein